MPPPGLHPGTGQPLGPADLAPLFPMALIMQEVSTDREIEIPGPVREIYKLWRPAPLFRAYRLEKALDTPARIFYKYEGEVPEHLVQELADAAAVATKLDMQMQRLHTEVHGHDANDQAGHEATFDTNAFQGLLSLAQQASTRGPEKCADN